MSKLLTSSQDILNTSVKILEISGNQSWQVRKESTKIGYNGEIHISTLLASIEIQLGKKDKKPTFVARFPFLTGKEPKILKSQSELENFLLIELKCFDNCPKFKK